MNEDNKVNLTLKDTKEALIFVFALVKAIDESLKNDGKFTLGDVPNFLNALLAVKAAFEDIDMIPVEFENLTEEQAIELKAFVGSQFDISDDKVEEAIEDAISVILDIWVIYSRYFNSKEVTNEGQVKTDTAETEVKSSEPVA